MDMDMGVSMGMDMDMDMDMDMGHGTWDMGAGGVGGTASRQRGVLEGLAAWCVGRQRKRVGLHIRWKGRAATSMQKGRAPIEGYRAAIELRSSCDETVGAAQYSKGYRRVELRSSDIRSSYMWMPRARAHPPDDLHLGRTPGQPAPRRHVLQLSLFVVEPRPAEARVARIAVDREPQRHRQRAVGRVSSVRAHGGRLAPRPGRAHAARECREGWRDAQGERGVRREGGGHGERQAIAEEALRSAVRAQPAYGHIQQRAARGGSPRRRDAREHGARGLVTKGERG
eukprot:2029717-Prymnesium_polylepis.1